jgi:AcrR family transcriptional regulator
MTEAPTDNLSANVGASPVGLERTLTPRGKERRSQLMDYAARQFAMNGYHPTSVADVVEGCGVGKGVFYWYFESKEALMHQILRDANYSLRRRQQQSLRNEPDPLRRLELGMHASMHWYVDNRHMVNVFQFAASEREFADTLRQSQENALADVMRHVTEAMESGRIRKADPTVLAQGLLGVTSQMVRKFLIDAGNDPDQVADDTIAFVFHGMGVTHQVDTAN